MERLVELARLLDFYGTLLTERQRALMAQYAYEDCSLGEISEREGISRQAVRDAIVHGESQLRAYEDKLRLIAASGTVQSACDSLIEKIGALSLPEDNRRALLHLVERIRTATEDGNGV